MKEKTKNNIIAVISILLYLSSVSLIETIIIIENIKTRRILGISVDLLNLLCSIFMGLYRNGNNKDPNNNNCSLNNIMNQLSHNNFGSLTNLNTHSNTSSPPPVSPTVFSSPLPTPTEEKEIVKHTFISIPELDLENVPHVLPKTPRNSKVFICGGLTKEQEEYLKSH